MEGAFEDIPLAEFMNIQETLVAEKKYAIIKLSNPVAETYLKYQAGVTINEFHKYLIKVSLGMKTEEEA